MNLLCFCSRNDSQIEIHVAFQSPRSYYEYIGSGLISSLALLEGSSLPLLNSVVGYREGQSISKGGSQTCTSKGQGRVVRHAAGESSKVLSSWGWIVQHGTCYQGSNVFSILEFQSSMNWGCGQYHLTFQLVILWSEVGLRPQRTVKPELNQKLPKCQKNFLYFWIPRTYFSPVFRLRMFRVCLQAASVVPSAIEQLAQGLLLNQFYTTSYPSSLLLDSLCKLANKDKHLISLLCFMITE